MATDALVDMMRYYDIEHTGSLNKAAWINLCSNDTINLSADVAGALFDGLDTDNDGRVKISDILKEMSIWKNGEPSPLFRLSRRSLDGTGAMDTMPINKGHLTSSFFDDGQHANDFHIEKVVYDDGSVVFNSTPVSENTCLERLRKLKDVISLSHPELLPTFNSVLDEFHTELLANKREQNALEEHYLREKQDRRRDLSRMEIELEQQLQRMEEKTKNELSTRIRNEYQALIVTKEREISEIRDQMDRLKQRVSHLNGNPDTPDSTTKDGQLWQSDLSPPTPVPFSPKQVSTPHNGNSMDRLVDIQARLVEREAELAVLKQQVSLQECQLMVDRRELMNQHEEKLQLHTELQTLRSALEHYHYRTLDDFESEKQNSYGSPNSNRSVVDSLLQSNQELLSHDLDLSEVPKPPERIFKVIMIGDTGVGKSSFMHQFCDGVFYPRLRATIGVDFRTKNLRVDAVYYSIQLWDTAGQEKYRSIVGTYFRKVDGILIFYDVTQPETFHNVRFWMEEIVDHGVNKSIPVMIIGNKIDLRDDENFDKSTCISTEVGENFAKGHDCLFIETSAANAVNIDEAVRTLSKDMKLGEDTSMAKLPSKQAARPKRTSTCCT